MIIFQQKKKKNRDFKRAIRLAKEIKIEKKKSVTYDSLTNIWCENKRSKPKILKSG